jgi:D-alanyl-D-alanine carboxypeptidase (penicillin-binding protein 5/6)
MKPHLRLAALSLLACVASAGASTSFLPPSPGIDARGYILVDFHSGNVLAEKNADLRLEPASLTKLMTAYTIFTELRAANIHMDDPVRISQRAWRTPGSRMFVQVDTTVPLQELLRGMIIQSGNDASVALAEHAAGSEEAFAALMNQHALQLGMTGSHFTNATGLPDPDHYTSARDVALLASAIIREHPQYYALYSEKSFSYNNITQYNRNRLLWTDAGVDGMKTGHTESAGYCLVSSAKRGEMRLLAVVLGTTSDDARSEESLKLLNYGFRFFETRLLYAANQPLTTPRVWKGKAPQVPLGLLQDVYITVPRGQFDGLSASLTVEKVIEAPAKRGQRFGTVNLRMSGEALAEQPLVALKDVPEGNLWRQVVDEVRLLFE